MSQPDSLFSPKEANSKDEIDRTGQCPRLLVLICLCLRDTHSTDHLMEVWWCRALESVLYLQRWLDWVWLKEVSEADQVTLPAFRQPIRIQISTVMLG
jgi:hypothetical protein